MSDNFHTTPVGVSNPLHHMTAAAALATFAAVTNDLLVMIVTDEDAGSHGGPALSQLCNAAADAEARCKTSVSHFLMRTDVDPVFHAAAAQIDGLLHDRGDTPDLLARYPRSVMRLADLCTLRAATQARRGVIDIHAVRCADALCRTAALLERMVQSALDDIAVPDAPTLSIQEMLSV